MGPSSQSELLKGGSPDAAAQEPGDAPITGLPPQDTESMQVRTALNEAAGIVAGKARSFVTAAVLEASIIRSLNAAGIVTVSLADFASAAEAAALSREERLQLIGQATILLSHLYPHLPYKQQAFQADPFTALRELEALVNGPDLLTEAEFHTRMVAAFNTVRDVHTSYVLPGRTFRCRALAGKIRGRTTLDEEVSYQGAVAFLPFQVAFYIDDSGRHVYVVSAVSGMSVGGFEVGSVLLSWNGLDMCTATANAAALKQSDNAEVNYARGVQRLTMRPVSTTGVCLGDPTATVEYLPPPVAGVQKQEKKSITLPWLIGTQLLPLSSVPSSAFSMSPDLCAASLAAGALYCKASLISGWYGAASAPDPFLLPGAFSFTFTGGPPGEGLNPAALRSAARPDAAFGYIKIKTFLSSADDPAQSLVDAFQQILVMMETSAPDGLILDIRGNTGGFIQGAERMLQMLTPRTIEPVLFHLAITDKVIEILQAVGPAQDTQLAQWAQDTLAGMKTADGHLSVGKPLTNPHLANAIGQIYNGPVVLLIDGLTYSAGDMFAAGFQDNQIGKVLGTDSRTGGGGASVWSHHELLSRLPPNDLGLQPLPGKAVIGLAMLRTSRGGQNRNDLQPVPIEDVGVSIDLPELLHHRTLNDVLNNSADLLAFACNQLASMPVHRIGGVSLPLPPPSPDDPPGPGPDLNPRYDGQAIQLQLQITGLDSIDIWLNSDERPTVTNHPVSEGANDTLTLPVPTPPSSMRILGYQRGGALPSDTDTPLAVRSFTFPEDQDLAASLAQAALMQFIDLPS